MTAAVVVCRCCGSVALVDHCVAAALPSRACDLVRCLTCGCYGNEDRLAQQSNGCRHRGAGA